MTQNYKWLPKRTRLFKEWVPLKPYPISLGVYISLKVSPWKSRPSQWGYICPLVWISKPVISCIEEEAMSPSIFYYCICAFLCCCRKFNLSLCRFSPFLLFYVAVSTSCLSSEFYCKGTSWNCMYLNKIPCKTHTHFKVQDDLQPFLPIMSLILI